MLLKLPNAAWREIFERSVFDGDKRLLYYLVSVPDSHRTLGQSGPHDAILLPLFAVRFSAVRTKVCADSPRSTQPMCLGSAWGQSEWQDISSTEVRARIPTPLHLYCGAIWTKLEVWVLPCMSGCVFGICENLLSTYLFPHSQGTKLLLRIQVQVSTVESVCLCIFLQH